MINSITTLLVLIVGMSLVGSIAWNRLSPHVGFALLKTAIELTLPSSQTFDWELKGRGTPKRIVLSFNRSLGFYHGKILVKNGPRVVGGCELPARPEYTTTALGFYNEDISRQTNVASIRIRNYTAEYPLSLAFELDQNVGSPDLKARLDLSDQEKIKVVVSGHRAVKVL